MRAVLVLGAALLVACVAPAGRTVAAEPSTICDSGAMSTGGSLLGAGAAAWLMAKRGLGPVGATVGGLASEKLGGAIAPMLCNFLGEQLSGEAKAAGPPGPMPWSAPPARLPFDPSGSLLGRPGTSLSGLASRRGLAPPGLLVDIELPRPPVAVDAAGKPDYDRALLIDMLRHGQLRTNPPPSKTMGGSEAARALGTCLSCIADEMAKGRSLSDAMAAGSKVVTPGLAGGAPRDVRSETSGGTTIEFRTLPRPAIPVPK